MFLKTKYPRHLIILITLCVVPILSWAQEEPQPAEPTSVIPYQGTLFSQGKAVSQSAPVQMAFALYTDKSGLSAGSTSAAPGANRIWTSWESTEGEDETVNPGSHTDDVVDDTISVMVRSGRFLVHLGEALADDAENTQVEIPDREFDNVTLYVITWVAQEVDGGGYNVFRLPPQKFETVPHAVTAKRANGFEVMGKLEVSGATELKAGLSVDGLAEFKGDVRADRLQTRTNGGNLEITSPLRVGSMDSYMLRVKELRGESGTRVANGQWQNIATDLDGLRAYQVLASASKSACHGMSHFIALYVYGDSQVRPTQVTAGPSGCKIELRLENGLLQIRSNGDYADLGNLGDTSRPNIRYSIIRLLEF